MTSILAWNCRGLGCPSAVNALKGVIASENPSIVFLMETRLKQKEMKAVGKRLRFRGSLAVSCKGDGRKRSGGLAMLWRESLEINIISYSLNHIDLQVRNAGTTSWRFTGIYGHLEEDKKHLTGRLLSELKPDGEIPWLCGGDLNLMLLSREKKGGANFKENEANILRHAVEECALEDLGFIGYEFTWNNNREDGENIQERLDRFLANKEWKFFFPRSFVTHLSKRRSDHLPILLTMKGIPNNQARKRKRKIFRFEEMWTRDEEVDGIIENVWLSQADLLNKLSQTASNLSTWSKEKFGDFVREIRECRN